MKRGFTLIELLIVMIIVGILVTVALPQYKRTVERGRATVGMSSMRHLAEMLNADYFRNNNVYPRCTTEITAAGSKYLQGMLALQNNLFGAPTCFESSTGGVSGFPDRRLSIQRDTGSGWGYSIDLLLQNGEISSLSCNGREGNKDDASICEQLGI